MKKKLRVLMLWILISLVLQFSTYTIMNHMVAKVIAPPKVASSSPITTQLKATIPGVSTELKPLTKTNPLFDTMLTLPNGQIVIPDQLDGQTVITHSVRWKNLLISLQLMVLPNHGSQSYAEILGNHSTVLSHSNVSTSAGTATLVLNERTPPAATKSKTPTYEYWVIVYGTQYAYAIEAKVIGNRDKAKSEVLELLNDWKVPK